MIQWWGYIHVDGSKQVKRYFNYLDIEDAEESPFVKSVHGPWCCETREEALELLGKEAGDGH